MSKHIAVGENRRQVRRKPQMVGRKRCVGREKTLSLPIKSGIMKTELERLVSRYRELGIESQIDYGKFYLYSIITH